MVEQGSPSADPTVPPRVRTGTGRFALYLVAALSNVLFLIITLLGGFMGIAAATEGSIGRGIYFYALEINAVAAACLVMLALLGFVFALLARREGSNWLSAWWWFAFAGLAGSLSLTIYLAGGSDHVLERRPSDDSIMLIAALLSGAATIAAALWVLFSTLYVLLRRRGVEKAS